MKRPLQYFLISVVAATFLALGGAFRTLVAQENAPVFRAGAAVVDTTPTEFPRMCNGGFVPFYLSKVSDPLNARAIVLDDGTTKIAFAVVDACVMSGTLRDEVVAEVEKQTGISRRNIVVSTTHCHSAPSLELTLGCPPDKEYVDFVRPKIVEALVAANAALQPARVGWGFSEDRDNVFCRRFYMKPGTADSIPAAFSGIAENKAMMNPGTNNPNAITRLGVPDPTVSVLYLQTFDGKPLALLGNYSTHYAGASDISADYFGVFREKIAELLGAPENFVAMMTNGTSGDSNCIDFLNPERTFTKETVGESVAKAAFDACGKIEFNDWVPVKMIESELTLSIRKPTAEEVEVAKEFLREAGSPDAPRDRTEVYAFDTIALADEPSERTLKLQGIRIGDLGIATVPCEVYSFTGRDLKTNAPTKQTFTISLANGYQGYIPTAESFELGGYNTWRARSCCLETTAEPKIRAELLRLLNEVSR